MATDGCEYRPKTASIKPSDFVVPIPSNEARPQTAPFQYSLACRPNSKRMQQLSRLPSSRHHLLTREHDDKSPFAIEQTCCRVLIQRQASNHVKAKMSSAELRHLEVERSTTDS